MKHWLHRIGQVSVILLATADLAMAEEAGQAAGTAAASADGNATWFFVTCVVSAAFGLAMAAVAGSLGQANAISKAVEGIARQPEASGPIQTAMIIGISFIESLTIYALVVALILLFANPFIGFFVK